MKIVLRNKRPIYLTLFIVYILIFLRLTIFRPFVFYERQFNLELFVDLINIYRTSGAFTFIWLFFGNIFWFVPLGFLMPMLLKRSSFIKVTAIGFSFSLFIEITQFISYRGVAELDDLILNTLGAAIGYWVFKYLSKFQFFHKFIIK